MKRPAPSQARRNLLIWIGHIAAAGVTGGVIGIALLLLFAYCNGFDLLKAAGA